MSFNNNNSIIYFISDDGGLSNSLRDEIKSVVLAVYKNIIKVSVNSSTLNSWTNKLFSRQTTLYSFLVSVISPKISSINITNLAQMLYVSILGREASISESSKLVSTFNEELRQYGSKERALKKLITYFVKTSSIVRCCNKLGIRAI